MSDKLIFKKIPVIIGSIEAVLKNHKNDKQNYYFRSIDDVYNSVNSAMAKEGVCISVNYEIIKNKTVRIIDGYGKEKNAKEVVLKGIYKIYAEDESYIECSTFGEAIDYGDKAINKAMTQSFKYLLFQVFVIPTEEKKDSEFDSSEIPNKQEQMPKQTLKQETKKDNDEIKIERDNFKLNYIKLKTILTGRELFQLNESSKHLEQFDLQTLKNINKTLIGFMPKEDVYTLDANNEGINKIFEGAENE